MDRPWRGAGRLLRGDAGAALANLGWLAAERLTQIGVAIVTSGVLARYLGPDVFGKWQYANTLLTVAAPLTWVCGAEILVPAMVAAGAREEASRNDGRRPDHTAPRPGKKCAPGAAPDGAPLASIMGSAFALRMAVSLTALALVWTLLAAGRALGHAQGPFDPVVAAMLAGLALTLVFREPFGVVSAWLQARTYSRPALLLSLSSALVKALAVFLLARAALPPGGFGGVWAVESAVIGLGLLIYQRRHAGFRWRVDPALLRHFAAAGSVFWLGLVCMYLFMKLDRLMLQHYVGFAELGRYAAAQQLNENWITLALMLAQTVAPAFVYRVAEPARLRRNLVRLLMLTGATMALGAVVIGACAPFIIRLVFGPGFEHAAAFLRWAAWLSVLAGLEAICNLIVLKYQARYVVLAKWAAALCAACVANLLLIPAFGGFGALAGLAIGYGVALAADAVYIQRVLSVSPS
ncbi:oligosaccharide flippase family protein [Robbsia sp. Bb-Pol-6]|uniref:Oligosaccharide flippase family protein n=1 Tax=Robbsia betulipollinis TaxID=2981849 RepID=A0ABT3ZMD2_9BURK|nr:oligosaccharide flippase family protein [Robbsia betulipollinis]MCY0387577.1 oligosaccharide flippase family protein [Robbsia betulipollinis]